MVQLNLQFVAAYFGVFLACASHVAAKAYLEPPKGQYYFGAWLDTTKIPGTNTGKDSPQQFNQRVGFNASLFQYAQGVPFTDETAAPLHQVFDLHTDAVVELTIYPDNTNISSWKDYSSLDLFTDANINQLVQQLAGYIKDYDARFLLRIMPEMNGNWMSYGQRPAKFVEVWTRMHDAITQANLDSSIDFVWAPNPGINYPYGGYATTIFKSNNYIINNTIAGMDAEFEALDTNHDGVVNTKDDPYSPYWPGDEYVDWVGLSIYYFGHNYPWLSNSKPTYNDFASTLISGNVPLYYTYARDKDKPFLITETSAAFYEYQIIDSSGKYLNPPIAIDPGPGNLAMKKEWFSYSIGNRNFFNAFPLVKGLCLFEYQKDEEMTYRNFQVTNRSIDNGDAIVDMFVDLLKEEQQYIIIANYTDPQPSYATGSTPDNTDDSTNPGFKNSVQWYIPGITLATLLVVSNFIGF